MVLIHSLILVVGLPTAKSDMKLRDNSPKVAVKLSRTKSADFKASSKLG